MYEHFMPASAHCIGTLQYRATCLMRPAQCRALLPLRQVPMARPPIQYDDDDEEMQLTGSSVAEDERQPLIQPDLPSAAATSVPKAPAAAAVSDSALSRDQQPQQGHAPVASHDGSSPSCSHSSGNSGCCTSSNGDGSQEAACQQPASGDRLMPCSSSGSEESVICR